MNKDQIFWNIVFILAYIFLVLASGIILYSVDRLPNHINVFDFFILSLAIFRLIRLFVYDWITKFIRDYFGTFQNGPRKTMSDLLSCPWCTGIWAAFFVSFSYFLTPIAWYPIFLIALAGAATYLQLIIIRIGKNL